MKLTAYLLDNELNATVIENNNTDTLKIGVVHGDSQRLLAINIDPSGEISCSYTDLDEDPEKQILNYLGRFFTNGTLELVAPVTYTSLDIVPPR